ncbi:MAG: acyltransferase family protein, partial [Ilumatobacter sp.]|nr:acyltransferase family protein [Ilumatobacter sp.]
SLAIEEQFYLLAPLALVGLLRWSKGAHRRLIAAAIALYLATVGLSFLIAGALGPDAAYLHTAARSGELVAGVLVAVVLHRRAVSDRWAVLTPIAGGGLVAAMLLTGSSTQSWPYHGGLPLFALLTAALLTGLQAPGHAKPMRIKSVLSAPVLTSVGAVSYGLYLVHWPVFVWLTADRLGVDGIALHVTRLAIVVALATASYVLVEQPIRRSSVGVATTLGLSVVAIAVVVMSTFSIPPPTTPFGDVADVDIQKAAAVAIAASPPVRPTPSASPVIPATVEDRPSTAVVVSVAEQPLRVLVVGDSTAVALGSGLVDHAFDQGGMQVSVAAHGGCGLVSGGRYRSEVSNAAMDMNCRDVFERQIPAILANATPDVVVVMITLADTWERSWDNSSEWLSPTDSEYAARIEDAYITFVTGMVEQGVEQIVWMRPPVSSYASDGTTVEIDSSFLDGGQEVIERVVEAQRIERPDVVSTLDLRAWFEASGLADDPASRPDGTHLSPDAAATVVEDWLVAELAALS